MIEQLKAKINFLSEDLHDLIKIINNGYNIASKIPSEDLKRIYYEELLPFVHDFDAVGKELIQTLEEYFVEETKAGIPANLALHKLYKQMVDDGKKKK